MSVEVCLLASLREDDYLLSFFEVPCKVVSLVAFAFSWTREVWEKYGVSKKGGPFLAFLWHQKDCPFGRPRHQNEVFSRSYLHRNLHPVLVTLKPFMHCPKRKDLPCTTPALTFPSSQTKDYPCWFKGCTVTPKRGRSLQRSRDKEDERGAEALQKRHKTKARSLFAQLPLLLAHLPLLLA